MSKNRRQRREREHREAKLAAEIVKATGTERKDRFSDRVLGLISFACGLAAWGWSVIAPNSSAVFGSLILFAALVPTLAALRRMWSLGKFALALVAVIVMVAFGFFDWYIVVKPQRGKPFQSLLVQGYHLTSQCSSLPARQQMPEWMRDQSKEWQAQVEQLISEKLEPKDSQIWNRAIVIGRASDENTVAYQCMWLANRVGALETIVATDFDHTLKRRDYTGPTYWFEPVNGKVDISEALKAGGGQANIAIEDLGNDSQSNQPVQVTGTMPQKH
jgi:hypothetical protein